MPTVPAAAIRAAAFAALAIAEKLVPNIGASSLPEPAGDVFEPIDHEMRIRYWRLGILFRPAGNLLGRRGPRSKA
jgi:hypothetical protein